MLSNLMDTILFTSSLALSPELEDAAGSVWVQQDISRQALKPTIIHGSAVCKLKCYVHHTSHLTPCTVCRSHLPAELSSSDDHQQARRQELTAYLQQLKHKQSVEPSADLTFGKDFYSLVQRLSQQRKTEYESIRGTASRRPCSEHVAAM